MEQNINSIYGALLGKSYHEKLEMEYILKNKVPKNKKQNQIYRREQKKEK